MNLDINCLQEKEISTPKFSLALFTLICLVLINMHKLSLKFSSLVEAQKIPGQLAKTQASSLSIII